MPRLIHKVWEALGDGGNRGVRPHAGKWEAKGELGGVPHISMFTVEGIPDWAVEGRMSEGLHSRARRGGSLFTQVQGDHPSMVGHLSSSLRPLVGQHWGQRQRALSLGEGGAALFWSTGRRKL